MIQFMEAFTNNESCVRFRISGEGFMVGDKLTAQMTLEQLQKQDSITHCIRVQVIFIWTVMGI